MKKRKIATSELIGIVFLIIVVIVASWYFFFYSPLQSEIAQINTECDEIDGKINVAMAKIGKMDAMQKELDEIFAASDDPSEIAVFDNSQAVMTQLDGILSLSLDYSLSFSNPTTDESTGIVRRSISCTFKARSYEEAKNILMALEKNHWRCIINSVALSSSNSEEKGIISDSETTVNASLVFFESTNIKTEESAQ